MTRHHHRIKTHAGWTVVQEDGRFTWTTPHGRVFVTDGSGTRSVSPRARQEQRRVQLEVMWPWAS